MDDARFSEIINKTIEGEVYKQFINFITITYGITDNEPNLISAVTYAYLKHNGYPIPFRKVVSHFNGNSTQALLMYRRLFHLYPHAIKLNDFREKGIIYDEIDNCLYGILKYKHRRFKYSQYFRNKCIKAYDKLCDIYDSDPITIACHVIFTVGKKNGNYVKEEFILKEFKIKKEEFRRLTRRVNKYYNEQKEERKEELRPEA